MARKVYVAPSATIETLLLDVLMFSNYDQYDNVGDDENWGIQ